MFTMPKITVNEYSPSTFWSDRMRFELFSIQPRIQEALMSVHHGSDRAISGDDLHKIFEDECFVLKYSNPPMETLSREEILKDAYADHADYFDQVARRIKKFNMPREFFILSDVAKDLPGAEELYEIMMSYRIFGHDPSTKIRRPTIDEINANDTWMDDLLL
jgi:hypothetical protein